ncbi:GerMN domain-containing protein [Nonomuraea sp. NPDC046570]|uniref:GerMN domain-containing protein n=1 Tax=Nonomuraea sp. NPDC046570 TaxID=3155255 RepID=UPI0033D7F631
MKEILLAASLFLAPAAPAHNVKVYFVAPPPNDGIPAKVVPVSRKAPDSGVAKFALQQLILGPTKAERRKGLTSDLGRRIRGRSDCGADFQLKIKKGVAKVRFCRTVWGTGVGGDATVLHQIETTLRQFPSVRKVISLDKDGRCLFEQTNSGRVCLGGRE